VRPAPVSLLIGGRWLLAAIKLLIVALIVWFVRGTIAGALAQVSASRWSFAPGWLALSAILYLLALLPEGLFWHRALRALGQDARLGETLRAYFVGSLGKYVPGKAMVVVLRTGLIRSPRVDTGVAVAGVFLSTLTMMSVGACVAAFILAIWFAEDPRLLAIALGMMAVAGLPTLPPVFSRLARLAGVGRGSAAADKLAALKYRTLLGGWLAMIIGWLLMGASLWAVMRAMGIASSLADQLHLDTATVAMAVVGGFISMIPGGLVAREAVLTELLRRQVGGAETALVAAAVLRLVWVTAEVIISAVLYVAGRRRTRAEG